MGKIRPKDLENGVAQPWANYYYGTNGNGQIWFHIIPWASASTGEADFEFGENIASWKLVFFWDGDFKERYVKWVDVFNNENMRAAANFWNDASHLRYRVKFDMPSETKYLSSVMLPITKVGTAHGANHWIYARIVTEGWDLVKESNRPVGNQFQSWQLKLDFWNVKLEGQTYWLELICNSTDGTNYFQLQYTSNQDYAAGTDLVKYGNWRYDGSIWVNDDNWRAIAVQMLFSIPTESWKVYECNSDLMDTCIPDGVTLETKTKWETGKVMVVWVSGSFSDLKTWLKYKLNSDPMTWHRWSRADVRFNYNASENKIADIFTCDFTHSISKLFMYIHCNNRTISNKLVAKIVTLDETTGLPSETLANENAIAKIPYADLVNNAWQSVIFKFPWEFSLIPNKKYALVLECEGTLSTSWYITTRYDNSTGNGSFYKMVNNVWTFQNAVYSLTYSFMHGDDVSKFQALNLIRNPNNGNRRKLAVWETNNVVSANRFVVSVPTKVKAITFCTEENGIPLTDMKVRIESNRIISAENNTNWVKYDGTWGSDYRADFGSTTNKKVAMKFEPSQDVDVKYLSLTLRKISSPSDKVTVRIETDDNGKPSGTLVSTAATSTSDQSLYTTQNTDYTSRWKFNENISLSKNTVYWIVLSKENDASSATSYYQVFCKNGWTFAWGSLYKTSDWSTWEAFETGNVKMRFYFNNSNCDSKDVPSGTLVAEWAVATLPAADYVSGWNYHTITFDQEVSLIPNTIYWLVFENFRPIVDGNYWQIFCSYESNWNQNDRKMTMPYLNLRLNEWQQWTIDSNGYFPRWWFEGERTNNGWSIDIEAWDFSGKEITAISQTAWVLSTGDIGIILRRTTWSWTWDGKFVFRAPRDGQITFLKDVTWTVRVYTYWNNYTPSATLTWTTAVSVNIEKGKLYQVEAASTDFIISLQ